MFTEAVDVVADERQTRGVSREIAPESLKQYLVECGRDHPRRQQAEAFVRKRFLESHGAHIATFMPTLLLLSDAAGNPTAVAGVRRATEEPLFLERYLSTPIEQAIWSRARMTARRRHIVEIGNFAALDSHCARTIMSHLPAYLLDRSATWIVFTATASIRRLLSALGGRCVEVGSADAARAGGGADDWGRYYANDPRVMAGFLPSTRSNSALWRPRHGN